MSFKHYEHHHSEHKDIEHPEMNVQPCDREGHQHHHHDDGSCCCEQHAKEFHGIDKPMLLRLILSAVCYLGGILIPAGETIVFLLMLLSALLVGYDILWAAVKNLLKMRRFDEYILMSIAAIAAFIIGECKEGAAVFLLYRIGTFFQSSAIRHSRNTIASLSGDYLSSQDQNSGNQFITRFARIYTPVILIAAVLIAVMLPLLSNATIKDSVYRALTFLVLACPCAIVISVPMTYFAGIGAASRKGIYFRNSEIVDTVAATKDVQTELVLVKDGDFNLAVAIARKTRRLALENILITVIVKFAVLILSILGISALWFAVFADSGITILVVLNALRAFQIPKKYL